MCFHNAMSAKIRNLAARYGRKSDLIEITEDIIREEYHVNAFNYPAYPIITEDEEIQSFHWGLIPHRTRTAEDALKIRQMTLNARSETLFEKPSYREAIRKRRCIIPATGFFEWRHEGKEKIPYYIFLKEEEIFSMAGIYEVWLDKETGEEYKTFTQITTGANELTGYIHNGGKNPYRMPAILNKADEEKWLDPHLDKIEIESLLKPYDAAKMGAYKVDKDFLKKNPHDPDIIRQEVS